MAEAGAFLWTVVVAVLPLPAEGPAIANALLFAAPMAVLTTWLGCVAGAALSYELARRGGRPLAERFLGQARIERIDRLGAFASGPGLLGLRLLPAVSFTGINWAAGLAAVNRGTFYFTTALGILPGVIAFTLLAQGGAAWVAEPLLHGLGVGLVLVGLVAWLARGRSWPSVPAPLEVAAWMLPLRARTMAGVVGGACLAGALFLLAPATPDSSLVASHSCVSTPTSPCCPLEQGG